MNLPFFFDHTQAFCDQVGGRDLILFLDYDGTLTPIVERPDWAVLSPEMREKVKAVSLVCLVAVVSGRATDDVRSKVQVEEIFYAGSHGFEIVAPDGSVTINEEAAQFRPLIDDVHARLSDRLKDVPGALVENVKFTISAHYRLVSEDDFPKVEQAVDEVLAEYPQLRKTHGKKVFEIRPRLEWDKGKAVAWILKALKFDEKKQFPLYIGDDTTDEDAFAALAGVGMGLRVADEPKPTKAQYVLRDTAEVGKLLDFVLENFGADGRDKDG